MPNRAPIIFLLFFLASCANSRSIPHRDGERVRASLDDPYTNLEVSVISPKEPGWIRERFTDSIVTLKKGNDLSKENQEIEIYITEREPSNQPTPTSTQQIKKNIQNHFDNIKEYKLQDLEVKEYPENNGCVRIYILLEDLENKENNNQKRWSEQHALSCNFPTHQRMGFEIRFYQRYYEQNKDNKFARKADALFKSLKVVDRRSNWIWRVLAT